MNGNMQLLLRLTADGSSLNRVMRNSLQSVRGFGQAAGGYFSEAARGMARETVFSDADLVNITGQLLYRAVVMTQQNLLNSRC